MEYNTDLSTQIFKKYTGGSEDEYEIVAPINIGDINEKEFNHDCPNFDFMPTIIKKVKRIIVIGDIHGDFDLVIRSFKLAKLINDKNDWIAEPKDTIVVQVGDQIDSCRPYPDHYECQTTHYDNDKSDDVKILEFFYELNKKAKHHGGAVYSLLGN